MKKFYTQEKIDREVKIKGIFNVKISASDPQSIRLFLFQAVLFILLYQYENNLQEADQCRFSQKELHIATITDNAELQKERNN